MKFISYKPSQKSFKNEVQHELWFVMDEIDGVCRYFLKCNGPLRTRSMIERVQLGSYGIYGTCVTLYDISNDNLEKFAKILKEEFFKHKEPIKMMAIDYRNKHIDSTLKILDDEFIGRWKD